MFFDDECKNIVMRIVEAYGLKTIKSLCDRWNISAGVMASRIQRNTFPYDYVLKCALETGANPMWLSTGNGESGITNSEIKKNDVILTEEDLAKLERLFALKEKGAITEEEFSILKNNLMKK